MPTFAERLADSGPGSPLLIGVIHLPPLPGSPRWPPLTGDHSDRVIARAWEDAEAYVQGGADAVIVENFGDAPFTPGAVAPETVAAMAVAGQAVRTVLAGRLALGFNVLRNDARAALALCAVCSGEFLRVHVLTGAAWTDQGLIQGDAYDVLRQRRALCPGALILADVHVKHAHPAPGRAALPIEEAARCQRAGIPPGTVHQSKLDLALGLIDQALDWICASSWLRPKPAGGWNRTTANSRTKWGSITSRVEAGWASTITSLWSPPPLSSCVRNRRARAGAPKKVCRHPPCRRCATASRPPSST